MRRRRHRSAPATLRTDPDPADAHRHRPVCSPWVLGRRLQKGGEGQVYLRVEADDPLRTRFVVKVVPLKRLSGAEPASAVLLRPRRHPTVEVLVDWLAVGPWGFLMSPYVDAVDLVDYVDVEGATPSTAELRCWARQLLGALQFAHARGVVHRDLKPENVLVCRPFEHCAVRLIDWGLAYFWTDAAERRIADTVRPFPRAHKIRAPPFAEQVTRIGTIPYMAPEVLVGAVRSAAELPRADVYGLGATLLFAATSDTEPLGDAAFASLEQWARNERARTGLAAADLLHHPSRFQSTMRSMWTLPEPFRQGLAAKHSPALLSFLEQCLRPHPADRASIESLLAHPWIVGRP